MDKVFEKFGIYDFMGVWGPGAIAITYYLLTIIGSPFFDIFNSLEGFGISQRYLLILLYTAVSYAVGVILHEIGKFVYDIFKLFDSETISIFNKNYKKKPRFNPFKRIRYDYDKAVSFIKTKDDSLTLILNPEDKTKNQLTFQYARNRLKCSTDINTKRLDVYHSIFALARSLSIAFAFHIVLAIIICIKSSSAVNICFLVLDAILAFLFFCRAYRYYLSWIKNTYIQYFFCIYIKQLGATNESNQTTKTYI